MVTLLPPLQFDDGAAWRLAAALDGLARALDRAGATRAGAVGCLGDWTGGARREFDRHSDDVQRQIAALAVAVRAAGDEVTQGVRDAAAERRRRHLVNDRRRLEAAREDAARREAAARVDPRTAGPV